MSGAKGGWSEASLLAWLGRRGVPIGTVGSPMHDAAVLKSRGRTVVCVDQVLVGVHARADVPAAQLGRKGVDRAASDLAATAAEPAGFLLALRLEPTASEAWAKALLRGAIARARQLGADVVGGDIAGGPGPSGLAVTGIGHLAGRAKPPGRDRAKPGDLVLVTGPTGGSGLGRHLRIEPRLAAGQSLWRAGARAMMDVSDGLGIDLTRLARASDVAIELVRVPVHRDARRAARTSGRTAEQHALEDGEDHELLVCLAPAAARRLLGAALDRTFSEAPGLAVVGRVRSGAGLWVPGPTGALEAWRGAGFVHGSANGSASGPAIGRAKR